MSKQTYKRALSGLSLAMILFSQSSFAAPPIDQYIPGETTNPNCAPGSANCDVDISSIDDQTLSFSGNLLVISDGNNVDLSAYLDNTDSQNLTLSGGEIVISGGNSIDISGVFTDTNTQLTEAQVDTFVSNNGYLTGYTDTDDQTLSFSGNLLVISDGNNVDLSAYLDNTDSQSLTLSGNILSISGGNNVTFPSPSFTLEGATDTDVAGSVTGSLLYNDGSQWVDLDVGTQGQKLVVGTGGTLVWQTDSTTPSVSLDIVQAINNSAQSIPHATDEVVTGWTTNINVGSNFDAATGVYTVPTTGKYRVSSNVIYSRHASNDIDDDYFVAVYHNGARIAFANQEAKTLDPVEHNTGTVDIIIDATAGDTITIRTKQLSGGSQTISAYGVGEGTFLNIQQLPDTAGVGVGGGSADGNGIVDANTTIGAGRTVGITDTVNFDNNTFVLDGTNNRIGIGTSSPNAKLSLGSNLADSKFMIWDGGSATSGFGFGIQSQEFRVHVNNSGDTIRFYNGVNGTAVSSINMTNGNYTATSDKRLKENISNTKVTLAKLLDLQVRDYNYTLTPDKKEVGLIAQEAHEVFPELVNVGTNEKNEAGNLIRPWTMNYSRLSAYVLQGLQELTNFVFGLDAKVEKLEAENAELKARLEAIEAQLAR